ANCFSLRRDALVSVTAKRPTTLFRIFNAVLDEDLPQILDRVVHLPGVSATVPMSDLASSRIELAPATKAHLEATGSQASVHLSAGSLFPAVRVRRRVEGRPHVAVIVPTRDRVDLLSSCIDSLVRSAPEIDKEIIVVDNDSSDQETLSYLRGIA